MDIRPLDSNYAVTPQITPEDIPDIAAAGFDTVICNRPDGENPPDLNAETLRPKIEAAGMKLVVNPIVGGALNMENVAAQKAAIEGGGKVLAYCASGNRSSIAWALALAGTRPTEELVAAGEKYGYQTPQFRDLIEKLAREG
ncbi:TIGR01244 family sulfur transferase [Pararhodobacter sp. SW119]|uniref:TIGR01244 family sulfur transferase n=1 Tax=Pararhodobacter sp. SW119 TaxID=2780075 RepID=UPI001AE08FA6|nr:TIGR01244 family sulfur transferase [Pararhodobacter sp. SW119]